MPQRTTASNILNTQGNIWTFWGAEFTVFSLKYVEWSRVYLVCGLTTMCTLALHQINENFSESTMYIRRDFLWRLLCIGTILKKWQLFFYKVHIIYMGDIEWVQNKRDQNLTIIAPLNNLHVFLVQKMTCMLSNTRKPSNTVKSR